MTEELSAPMVVDERGHANGANVGAKLRAARERLGLSLGDIAERLKYAPRQVEALEEGRYEALPSLTFQRGFVRGYAKLLGLDAGALVGALEAEVGRDNGPSTEQLQQVAYSQPALTTRPTGQSAWRWVVAMVFAIVAIGGYSLHEWEPPVPVTIKSSPPPAVRSISDENPPRPTDDAAVERRVPLPTPLIEQRSVGGGREGALQFIFDGESWIEVRDASGGVILSGTFRTGAEQTADGQPPFDLTVGNARLVKLYYRGAEVDLAPYTKVSVARLQLK